ncbi:MAG: IMP dehydrogenase [Candidatus Latescibacteria bacterium]|nr:IMP dehydrogenase [Candidatus Latescibacterota bacterium]
MSIQVALTHKTHYQFDRLVGLSPHIFRLRPAPHCRTPIKAYSLQIDPEAHFINWQQDPFGNYLARVVFPEQARRLGVTVDLVADMTVINPFDFFLEDYAQHFPFTYQPQLRKELAPYLETSAAGPLLLDWLAQVDPAQRPTNDFLVALNQRLCQDIEYAVRMEPGVQSCEETLQKSLGSCRDSGWLLVQILRHLGLAARFVSGYLVQLTADEKALDGPSGPEADFTDLHAWAEVYVPGAGWLGLDPTSGLFAGEGHIPLACTPEPASAAPVSGGTDPCQVEFSFANTVERIHQDPRVTKPYSQAQWQTIDALGNQVDNDLEAGDVRLTMGGEPTFVSIDDMEGEEWNTAADGPTKRRLAADLLVRLSQTFAPGAMRHFGQGKLYPGEVLPRWQYSCFWRTDEVPVWRNPKLLANLAEKGSHGLEQASTFIAHLTQTLGLDPKFAIPGYEDAFYFLWSEGTLPTDIDPLKADLQDELERRKLADLLDRGLGQAVGYLLPLRWHQPDQAWQSSTWPLRRQHLFLVPGDSPMGLRLPLDSLPAAAADADDAFEPCPLQEKSPLENYHQPMPAPAPSTGAAKTIIRTCLCVEARQGRLHVFLPPLNRLEHYLRLVAAVELTAAALSLSVVLEGYEPPADHRLQRLKVTPDPGVIEVNIHPAANWSQLVHNTTALYAQARQTRLSAEKFMLDGRHTGTGGGNHITLGGPTPADSPFLRRPDLLQSLVTYWQHHPALSYLFSGLFIGPTSQAPRIDEGRDEKLYELEIAFDQLPEGTTDRPWLVDRLLRHLLVDLTGNTHRAEFCIDKLYAPDSASGRQGLVEFRAFEMPPHARMSLVQMLLLRSLVARFWKKTYQHKLVRWGTQLHDRFMLPHFLRSDMAEVVEDLQKAGYPFQLDWLDPFCEFRFPRLGTVQIGAIQLELRQAIEPWHVLGEEMSRAGTARFVDSSVERLQVKVTGLTDSRHVLLCNGCRIPLQATGTHGEYVVGVRYRAWQPPSALHPTIGVHSPLVFDLVDTWNGRPIGGCTYRVDHPGGRNYEVFPVNAYEAEARRLTLFENRGHTPGPIEPPPTVSVQGLFAPAGSPTAPPAVPPEIIEEEYPYTLDLRRHAKPA